MKESKLQAEIIAALGNLKSVAFVRNNLVGRSRMDSGYVSFGHKNDLDIFGLTKNGKYFEIEVKVEGQENKNPERVKKQRQRVVFIRNNLGLSGFANSIEQAKEIVEQR